MSQYLDKEKLLKWIDRLADHNKLSQAYYALDAVQKEVNAGTFDNYAAHNAVALLDDLEIKLNKANREIERLREDLDMIEIHNGSIDSFDEIDKILSRTALRRKLND